MLKNALLGNPDDSPAVLLGYKEAMIVFRESAAEETALLWLNELGYWVLHGNKIAPGEPGAERDDLGELLLSERLREAL